MPALENRPVLEEEYRYAWDAWIELHASRQVGMGPNPIAVSDIKSWMEIHGYDDVEDRVDLYELVVAMDLQWLTWAKDELDRKKKPKKKEPHADAKNRHRRDESSSGG